MFKGRLGLWVFIIILSFALNWGFAIVPTLFESDDLSVKVDIATDIDMAQVLANKKINKINIKVKNDDPDVIITTKDIDKKENYIVYEDYLYSPLVMYVRADVYNNSIGFINVPDNIHAFKVDLYDILVAMEEGKEWKDLGVHKDVVNGPVTVYIPNEQNPYYNHVISLIYLTLNHGEIPDEKEIEVLRDRVDNILSKCNMVSDISSAVYAEYKDSIKTHKVFIGPEYLFRRGKESSMSRSNYYSFQPVYFLNTVYITADVYVKNIAEGDVNVGNQFVENMKTKYGFMSETGWRMKDSSFDLDSISCAYCESPSEFAVTEEIPQWVEKEKEEDVDNTTPIEVIKPIVKPGVTTKAEATEATSEPIEADPVNMETTTQEAEVVSETKTETIEASETNVETVEENGDTEWTTIDVILVVIDVALIIFLIFMIVAMAFGW